MKESRIPHFREKRLQRLSWARHSRQSASGFIERYVRFDVWQPNCQTFNHNSIIYRVNLSPELFDYSTIDGHLTCFNQQVRLSPASCPGLGNELVEPHSINR